MFFAKKYVENYTQWKNIAFWRNFISSFEINNLWCNITRCTTSFKQIFRKIGFWCKPKIYNYHFFFYSNPTFLIMIFSGLMSQCIMSIISKTFNPFKISYMYDLIYLWVMINSLSLMRSNKLPPLYNSITKYTEF